VQIGAADAGKLVTHVDRSRGQRAHFSPQFLPDGDHFLFAVGGPTEAETWIGSLDGGEPRLLLRADAVARYAEPGYLIFRRRPLFVQRVHGPDLRFVGDPVRLADVAVGASSLVTHLALSTSTAGALVYAAPLTVETQVVWRDRNVRTLGPIDLPGASEAPSLARDGTMMVLSRRLPQTGMDLSLYDLKWATLMRFTFDSAFEHSAIWSPDRKSVAFAARRDGFDRLYRKSTTGSGTEETLSTMSGTFSTD
jgi:hypothetical protein